MALTPEEEQELEQLKADLAGSVMLPQEPKSIGQQVKEAVVQSLPEMGGMAGGVAGALLTRSPMGARAGYGMAASGIRGMIGAGLGGSTGEAARQAITGRPSAVSLFRSGIEQAAYDGLGNLFFSAGGKVYRYTKDRLSKAIDGPVPDDPVVAAQQLLQQERATLTPFQATGNPWEGFKESVARGSFTGKPVFEEAEKKTKDAIMNAKSRILDEVSTRVYDSVQTGKEFAAAISEGDEALKSLSRPFYEALNKSPKIARQPVDITGMKEGADALLARDAELNNLVLSPKEREYLSKFATLPTKIDFLAAHEINSSLKTTLRDLKRNKSDPDSRSVAQLTGLITNIEKNMDVAGSKFSGTAIPFEGRIAGEQADTLAEQYKFYSKFYREGINDLYNDTAAKLLDVDPEFVGKNIFKAGNVTAWQEATTALARAKKVKPDLDVNSTIQAVRRGYLEDLLKSEGSFASLADKIKNDEALRRTFEAVLPPAQQKRVRTLLNAAKLSETSPSASAPLFFAAQQAQATGTLLSVGSLLLSDDARKLATDNPMKSALVGGTILLGPRFWAKAALDPDATNAALKIITSQNAGEPLTANALLKISQAFEKVKMKAEDLLAPTPEPATPQAGGAPLSAEEEDELQRLKAELGQ